MALTFERVINLTLESPELGYVAQPYMAQEHKGQLFDYFITPATSLATDADAVIEMSDYENIQWGGLAHHLTVRAVSKIGIKQFPKVGAIGFYTNKYTNKSTILAPVQVDQKTFNPPSISASFGNGQVHVTIIPPEDITYTVYRLIFRQEYFADERIVYLRDVYLTPPLVRGNYSVTCIGYNEDTGVVSSESNVVTITIPTGMDEWLPEPISMALRNLADVYIGTPTDLQLLQYKSTSQKWENTTIPKVHYITLLATDWDAANQQTISITGIVADESKQFIQITPTTASREMFETCVIRAVSQQLNAITFLCATVPDEDITLYITVSEVYYAS